MGFVWGVIPLFANHPIQLFGDTSTVNEALENYRIQSIVFAPNVFPVIDASTGNFI
jgi:hypothetical protein